MKFSPDDQHLIEQYLNNELAAVDRLAFEQRLLADPGLARELASARLIQQELSDPAQLHLLQTLEKITNADTQPRRNQHWRYAAAALLLLLTLLAWWWITRPAPTPAPAQPASPARPEVAPAPVLPSEKAPIAAADPRRFKPHPVLEPLAGTQLRGGDLEATFTGIPKIRATNQGWSVRVAGQIKSDQAPNTLELALFDNQERNWKNNRPVKRFPLRTQAGPEAGTYTFQQSFQIQTPPGRYYLLLTEKGSAEPLATTKIMIGDE